MSVRSLIVSASLHMLCVGGGILLQSVSIKLGVMVALLGPYATLVTLTTTKPALQKKSRAGRQSVRKAA